MKYFAYGSNMSIARLRSRVPNAWRLGVFTLAEHALRFHKRARDGSGKCDAYLTGNPEDSVTGVLFEIPEDEVLGLDKAESLGTGYFKKKILVENRKKIICKAFVYCANQPYIDPFLEPYSWYLYHVVRGAKEAGIPTYYIDFLKRRKSKEDKCKAREEEEYAIYSGYE